MNLSYLFPELALFLFPFLIYLLIQTRNLDVIFDSFLDSTRNSGQRQCSHFTPFSSSCHCQVLIDHFYGSEELMIMLSKVILHFSEHIFASLSIILFHFLKSMEHFTLYSLCGNLIEFLSFPILKCLIFKTTPLKKTLFPLFLQPTKHVFGSCLFYVVRSNGFAY